MEFSVKLLGPSHKARIIPKIKMLNPAMTEEEISTAMDAMFQFDNYHCFGIFSGEELLGLSGGWISVKFYSGKQLEVDNFIIDNEHQSKGLGKILLDYMENWAHENGCKSVELNTYVTNSRSHKFYFRNGYEIKAFHFVKKLGNLS